MYLASVGLGAKLDEVKWAILPEEQVISVTEPHG